MKDKMRLTEIINPRQLWNFMTDPSPNLIEYSRQINGDILILGGSGKMGKELIGLLVHADGHNQIKRKITVASTFSNPQSKDINFLEKLGITCIKGDLSDEKFIKSLPSAPNIFYMMGFKFGSSSDWRKAFHLNAVVPYLIGKKYPDSSIVVFSSGNPYPHTSWKGPGCSESDPLQPLGVYGWCIVARESSFKTTAIQNKNQKTCFYRLMYAQHLCYGVLVDLARMVLNNEPVSVAMPAVNLISQRDANEVAIRSLQFCNNSGWIINAAGPVYPVRTIVEKLGVLMDKKPLVIDQEPDNALLANDALARQTFAEYRDSCDDMIQAAAQWVLSGGEYWNKPTHFGKVKHDY